MFSNVLSCRNVAVLIGAVLFACPPVVAQEPSGEEMSAEMSMIVTIGCILALFACIWFSNSLHDSHETQKQKRNRLDLSQKKLPPVVIPKVVPARPRHPVRVKSPLAE